MFFVPREYLFASSTTRRNKQKQIQGSFATLRMTTFQGMTNWSGWERGREMQEYAYVYIVANGFKKLYVGITTELEARIRQHKDKVDPECHTARYNINQLVHFERFTTVPAAIKRESSSKVGCVFARSNWSFRTILRGATLARTGANRLKLIRRVVCLDA